jgi:cytochrome c5
MHEHVSKLVSVMSLTLFFGCNGPKEASLDPTPAAQAAPEPVAPVDPSQEARTVYSTRCAACHGPNGRGDGAGAAALEPKPRAFNDSEWQQEVGDDYLRKIIIEGGAAVEKSVSMPGHPDLQSKPEVLAELIKHVRSFAH